MLAAGMELIVKGFLTTLVSDALNSSSVGPEAVFEHMGLPFSRNRKPGHSTSVHWRPVRWTSGQWAVRPYCAAADRTGYAPLRFL